MPSIFIEFRGEKDVEVEWCGQHPEEWYLKDEDKKDIDLTQEEMDQINIRVFEYHYDYHRN